MKCIVTGGSGLLGKTLRKIKPNYIYLNSKDLDLTDYASTKLYFDKENPDIIIHLAAKVGGIKDNATRPYEFISLNNKINTSVIDWCVLNNKNIFRGRGRGSGLWGSGLGARDDDIDSRMIYKYQ